MATLIAGTFGSSSSQLATSTQMDLMGEEVSLVIVRYAVYVLRRRLRMKGMKRSVLGCQSQEK
jgi:hypothetical protein